ncbi:CaiB/BaiF CoA transferase family protein [Acinetobacter indicus]|uniref:CaiB/BaiF CoA transferase family protein n=1 Tax=Acinetobacter indicus TaxID=756892 RepID=UPI0014440A3F|nr:CaiB/BaiF CoA-transferase family protein [Acinetobacter indicus]
MSYALNGLKVLDFSTLLPGPFATLYLADLGAEVVHIESPNRPDLVRLFPPYANGQATSHSYLNRNKQSVTLDLKDPDSIAQIKAKIKDYDIVVEQFRPGVMQRLGLDYATLAEIHPGLIYCSITGYGQSGSYQAKAGHDINYLALSGIAGHSGRAQSGPPPMGIQIADVAGGSLHALVGILAAVIERQSSGQGQYIDISMTDCVAALNNMAAAASLAGQEQQRPEAGHLNGAIFYDYYRTSDGRYLSIGGLEPQFMQGLAEVLELPLIVEKGSSFDSGDRQAVKQAIGNKIQSKSWAEWQQIFAGQDVCVEPVLYLEEALHSPLAQQREWVVQVPLEQDSPDTEAQLACPIKFSRSKARYDFRGQGLGQGNW